MANHLSRIPRSFLASRDTVYSARPTFANPGRLFLEARHAGPATLLPDASAFTDSALTGTIAPAIVNGRATEYPVRGERNQQEMDLSRNDIFHDDANDWPVHPSDLGCGFSSPQAAQELPH